MSSGVDPFAVTGHGATSAIAENARALEGELAWFERVLSARLERHFKAVASPLDIAHLEPPHLAADSSPYAGLLRECGLGLEERLVLLLALAPHLRPHLLDLLFVRNPNFDRGFSEFGGRKGPVHGGFLPTLETASFLVAGDDLAARFRLHRIFEDDHVLRRNAI